MQQLVIASHNAGKINEFKQLLAPLSYQVLTASDFDLTSVAETGLSFVENALIKARYVCQQTQLPCLADDSGLIVDALQGAPGLHSARYVGNHASDNDNIKKLLDQLKTNNLYQPKAAFHCSLVLLRYAHDPNPIIAQGNWYGEITAEPKGDNGFGYDPIFYLPELKCTAAQLATSKKNTISHRAQAISALIEKITCFISQPH